MAKKPTRNLEEAFFLNEWVARSIFKQTVVRLPAYMEDNGCWVLYTTDFNWKHSLSYPLTEHIQSLIEEGTHAARLMPCWKSDGDSYEVIPDFSGNMAAAHNMEKELHSLGFRDHYISALIKSRQPSQEFYWYLLHEATPHVRCTTAKSVVLGNFDEMHFESYKKNFFG